MDTRGHYHFNHRVVGKKSSAPGTAAAKVRYMLRAKACENVVTVGLSLHPKALERVANENERDSRANARVCDTFIVALPVQMTAEQRLATTRSFLWQLTDGGKAKAFAAFHGGDTHNPHIHVMFFDRDSEGKRVQKMSERGSTERMRELWERSCNSKLEEFGIDIRIDRRTLEEQMIERAGPIERYDTESPETPLADDEPAMALSDEEDGMITREGEHPSHVWVKDAVEYANERDFLHAVQDKVIHFEAVKIQALDDASRLKELTREYRKAAIHHEKLADIAGEQLKPLTRPNGKLRGFEVPLVGWKSPKRARGEELATEKSLHEQRQAIEQKNARDAAYSAEVSEKRAIEAEQSAEAHQRELDTMVQSFGDKATLDTADKVLDAGIQEALSKVTLQEIYADFENGEITGEEAIRAFELLGAHAMCAAVRERMAIEEEMDPKGAYANDNEVEM